MNELTRRGLSQQEGARVLGGVGSRILWIRDIRAISVDGVAAGGLVESAANSETETKKRRRFDGALPPLSPLPILNPTHPAAHVPRLVPPPSSHSINERQVPFLKEQENFMTRYVLKIAVSNS